MKVAKRIILKVLILLIVIAAGVTGSAAWQGYRQSTPEDTIERYLTFLIESGTEKAYAMLDQSENSYMTEDEYASAVEGKKYGLYASFTASAQERRRDEDGNEYIDFHVTFLNAADEVQAEEDMTLKKQQEAYLGLFDVWNVSGDHCMVRNFQITVPAGSSVYLNGEAAEASWMTRTANSPYTVCTVPQMLPGEVSLTVRHPVLESINTTIHTSDGAADYSGQAAWKESAQDECKEYGVAVLKNLLTASAKQEVSEIDGMLSNCQEAAESFVERESALLYSEDREFRSLAASAFAVQFTEPAFSEENGGISTEMTFSYHYVIKWDVTSLSEDQLQEDGTPMEVVETVSESGNSTARMEMEYKDGAWSVTGLIIPTTEE